MVYLNEIDLEFEVPERPLYSWNEKQLTDEDAALKWWIFYTGTTYPKPLADNAFQAGCRFKEEQIKGKPTNK